MSCASVPIPHALLKSIMRECGDSVSPASRVPTQRVEQWPEREVERSRAGVAEALLRLHGVSIGTGWVTERDAIKGGVRLISLASTPCREACCRSGFDPRLLEHSRTASSP